MLRGLPWAGAGSAGSAPTGSWAPSARGSPPRTPRSPRRTLARRRARSLPVRDVHEMMMQCLII